MDCIKGQLAYGFILISAAVNNLVPWLPNNLEDMANLTTVISAIAGTILVVQQIAYNRQRYKLRILRRLKSK